MSGFVYIPSQEKWGGLCFVFMFLLPELSSGIILVAIDKFISLDIYVQEIWFVIVYLNVKTLENTCPDILGLILKTKIPPY